MALVCVRLVIFLVCVCVLGWCYGSYECVLGWCYGSSP